MAAGPLKGEQVVIDIDNIIIDETVPYIMHHLLPGVWNKGVFLKNAGGEVYGFLPTFYWENGVWNQIVYEDDDDANGSVTEPEYFGLIYKLPVGGGAVGGARRSRKQKSRSRKQKSSGRKQKSRSRK